MIESALTAIAELLEASGSPDGPASDAWPGAIVPTGTSTNAGATRLPTSPACGARPDGHGDHDPQRAAPGRLAARRRGGRGAPRRRPRSPRRSRCRPARPSPRGCARTAPRRSRTGGPGRPRTSNGPRGGAPIPISARRRRSHRDGRPGERRAPATRPNASIGCSTRSSAGSRSSSADVGDGAGAHAWSFGGRAETASGSRVEQRRRDQHAADPVRQRVVQLQEHRRPVVLQALEDVQLPERLRRVERTGQHAPDRAFQLEPAARRRHGRPAQMEVEVELLVVDPQRPGQSRRQRRAPAAGGAAPDADVPRRPRRHLRTCSGPSSRGANTDTPATCMCMAGRSR